MATVTDWLRSSAPDELVTDLAEHISMWSTDAVNLESFLARLDLGPGSHARFESARRLWASFWLLMLLPDGLAHGRNPPGTLERQAERVLTRYRWTKCRVPDSRERSGP